MVTLDATNANELMDDDSQAEEGQEAQDGLENAKAVSPVRRMTIELPKSCKTSVVLLFQRFANDQFPAGLWHTGYEINRTYDGLKPGNDSLVCMPDGDEIEGYNELGNAVVNAVESANWVIELNSDDGDKHASRVMEFLKGWTEEFESETASVGIFDDATDEEVRAAKEAAEQAEAEEDDEEEEDEDDDQVEESSATEPVKPGELIITDEAQADFEKRKHGLEEILGRLAIEGAHLKASTKANRESQKAYCEELEKHILRGPERLPLFEIEERRRVKAAREAKEAEAKAKQAGTEPTAAAEGQAKPGNADESPRDLSGNKGCQVANRVATAEQEEDATWRKERIVDVLLGVCGVTEKIVELLAVHDIWTMGDLTDAPRVKGCELTQLKGITEARFQKVQDATDAFWSKRAGK